jgi:hypothetical protein
VISDHSSGNPPKLQHRLIARKFRVNLGFVILVLRGSPKEWWLRAFLLARDGMTADVKTTGEMVKMTSL